MFKFIRKIEKKVYLFKDLRRGSYVLFDNGMVYDVDEMFLEWEKWFNMKILKFYEYDFKSLNDLYKKERVAIAKTLNNEIAFFSKTEKQSTIFDFLQYLYDVLTECTIDYVDDDLDIVHLSLDEKTCEQVAFVVFRKYINR